MLLAEMCAVWHSVLRFSAALASTMQAIHYPFCENLECQARILSSNYQLHRDSATMLENVDLYFLGVVICC